MLEEDKQKRPYLNMKAYFETGKQLEWHPNQSSNTRRPTEVTEEMITLFGKRHEAEQLGNTKESKEYSNEKISKILKDKGIKVGRESIRQYYEAYKELIREYPPYEIVEPSKIPFGNLPNEIFNENSELQQVMRIMMQQINTVQEENKIMRHKIQELEAQVNTQQKTIALLPANPTYIEPIHLVEGNEYILYLKLMDKIKELYSPLAKHIFVAMDKRFLKQNQIVRDQLPLKLNKSLNILDLTEDNLAMLSEFLGKEYLLTDAICKERFQGSDRRKFKRYLEAYKKLYCLLTAKETAPLYAAYKQVRLNDIKAKTSL